jgi:hypothetical protein
LAVVGATSATATLADVQGDFVAELDGLEGSIIVQTFASVARIGLVGDVVALGLPKLRHACWTSAL